MRARDAKLVLSFKTRTKYRALSDLLRSLIVSGTCTSTNAIYYITCTIYKKLYIGDTGRRLGDRFREHLCDAEKDDKDASKAVARHFNFPNHFKEDMSICGLSLHQGTTDSRKNLEQRFIFHMKHRALHNTVIL